MTTILWGFVVSRRSMGRAELKGLRPMRRGALYGWCFGVAGCLVAWPLLGVPPLVQLPGAAACVSETGTGGACLDGAALDGPISLAVTHDGRSVFVASQSSDAVVVFDRNVSTGALTPKPGVGLCVSETGTGGLCAVGKALDGPQSIAVSPNGRSVYVASFSSSAIAIFNRDVETGVLTQKAGLAGCVSETGTGGLCTDGVALDGPVAVVVSADGRNVYVASVVSDAVAIFGRDASTGVLTQQAGTDACVSETGTGGACKDGVALDGARFIAVSPFGHLVYVASQISDAVAVLDRNDLTGALQQLPGLPGCVSATGTGGACSIGTALDGPFGVAVSPDGWSVYVASFGSDAVAVFDHNVSGQLTQKAGLAGCVSDTGTGGACADGVGLEGAVSVTVSPDGRSVYVGSNFAQVAIFDRDAATGALDQQAGVAACVSDTGAGGLCTDGVGLLAPVLVAVTSDGRSAYVASSGSDAVAAFTREVPPYDIDGDGETGPLTDGLLLLRYTFGFTGATLVTGAVDLPNCTRCTARLIEAYVQALLAP